ncbi:amino acid ABC transporter substrate-binding protein [Ligilactobacillus salitolerans]|uniref:Amino acid ABC transporter substrate-binding protein n=1 Tax=Ligilactobacillus salitolerans TaxID=1808352 RepID=A0A401IT48_9LACO|nr:amino acid ABC transporter substrate-binding protein [Ligilactobacillus salitolerans]GBG94702.1 amino acid ABC transporter substrate-binding protein [Ligilactobacillus salitolerans]
MKRKNLFTCLLVLACTVILSGCGVSIGKKADQTDNWSQIKQRGYVTIGVDDTFVPMGFRQKNGQLVGYDVDLAKAVFKLYGVKTNFQTIDWAMNATELKNGTIDLIWNGFTKTPERQAKVAFSRTYLRNDQVLVSLKKNHINSYADMTGKVLGAQTGSSGSNDINKYPKLLKNRIKDHDPVLYESFTNAFIDLNSGRIQGLLIDSSYADYYIAHQKNPGDFQTIRGAFPPEAFGVGMRKSDDRLRQKVNAGLKKLAADGTLERINQKWFGDQADSPLLQNNK